MLDVSIVIGNPKPNSRTGRIAEMVIDEVLAGVEARKRVIDLAQHADELFRWPSQEMADLNERVADCDLVVFASPTYKATYTGLLKAFLDRYPANGLKKVTAVPIMTGAGLGHSMAPTTNLIPLLMELGASVPWPGFYFNISQMDQIDEFVAATAGQIVGRLRGLAPLAATIGQQSRVRTEGQQ